MTMRERHTWVIDITAITFILILLYGLFLGSRPLTPPDEGRYSEIPREMVVSHDYVTPHLNGIKYFEKPPLFYWIQTASIQFFGLNEWSLRLSTALMGGLGVILTYWGTRKLFNRRSALLSATVLATSFLYAGLAHFITVDMTVSVLLTGCLLCFLIGTQQPEGKSRRNYMWAMYIFAALATLTKGLIGILLPGMVIFIWILLYHQWSQLKTYCLVSGSLLFLAITLPWHILVQLKNPEFFHFYFIEQHFLRYLTDYASREKPVWFFPAILLLGFFPWTGFLFQALKSNFSKLFKLQKSQAVKVFLLLWGSVIFLFYWVSHSQLPPYILPIFPALAILVGIYLDETWDKTPRLGMQWGYVFASILTLGLLSFMFFYFKHYPEKWLALPAWYFYILPLLLAGNLFATLFSWQKKSLKAFLTLTVAVSFFIVSGNLIYVVYDTRSVKNLAIELNTLLQPNDQIIVYHNYLQDLPVYLQKPITISSWTGELLFGSQHQSVQNLLIKDDELWKRWQSSQRVFLFIRHRDYNLLQKMGLKVFPIAKSARMSLICNQEISL